jgi:hypothetical protein
MSASVIYHFYAAKGEETLIALHFDPRTYRLQLPTDPVLPEWAKLNFNRCPNCTLADSEEYCPAAAALAQFLPCFESRFSYEKTTLQVETGNRTIVAQTTFQHGIAGVIGLAMATSGCPRTLFLRPMARTHLPLATEEETVFRSLAIHLLSQYVAQSGSGGAPVSLSLQRLKEDYGHLSQRWPSGSERRSSGTPLSMP